MVSMSWGCLRAGGAWECYCVWGVIESGGVVESRVSLTHAGETLNRDIIAWRCHEIRGFIKTGITLSGVSVSLLYF